MNLGDSFCPDGSIKPWVDEVSADPSLDTELLAGTGALPGEMFPSVAEEAACMPPLEGEPDDEEADPSASSSSSPTRRIPKMPYVKLYSTGNLHGDLVLTTAVGRFGWKKILKFDEANIIWFDKSELFERLRDVQFSAHQKINLFPGMKELCQKAIFARHLNRMEALFPEDFDFCPTTYVLPYDSERLKADQEDPDRDRNQYYIVKPSANCGGEGIYLTKDLKKIELNSEDIIQEYIDNPLTVEGFKFDFRIYVAVMSLAPLRIYVHREGLARLATEKYHAPTSSNFRNTWMHLTNYSLNKYSPKFVNTDDETTGTKRSISAVMDILEEDGHDIESIWFDIETIIAKTMISLQPSLQVMYDATFCKPSDPPNSASPNQCFQLLGFDIMLDDELIPWLVEVNGHPSLQIPDPIDEKVKRQVVTPLLHMIAYDAKKNKKKAKKARPDSASSVASESAKSDLSLLTDFQKRLLFEEKHCGSFKLILPSESMPDFSNLYLFNDKIRDVFTACCGVRSKHEMTASRFRKFATECKICTTGTKVGSAGNLFTSPELDLLFIKQTKMSAVGSLGFFEFCDVVLYHIAPRLCPNAGSPLQTFMTFVNTYLKPVQL
eukprot:TRINITY_DN93971_c0_g1_i1.p1 TRINITY_DN93971_c0_g1~~TRINITY_DN93971_c0_g1_i1.p1  ORF type:complete len:607 (-),score=26.48 TRINITY_DN93971_c0_g1_i1:85-1905(-)